MKEKSSAHTKCLDIAIVGMAARFPGADSIEEFWENLSNGVESIKFADREAPPESGSNVACLNTLHYVGAASSLKDIDRFDAAFFRISNREAEVMDPQHRLFLECAWEAYEQAGRCGENNGEVTGVYAGSSFSGYLLTNLYSHPEILQSVGPLVLGLGNNSFPLTTRVSYKLNLKGPSIRVQTACSTSLVAVHVACQSLLTYGCHRVWARGGSLQVAEGAW